MNAVELFQLRKLSNDLGRRITERLPEILAKWFPSSDRELEQLRQEFQQPLGWFTGDSEDWSASKYPLGIAAQVGTIRCFELRNKLPILD
jgi:hypothetical protein